MSEASQEKAAISTVEPSDTSLHSDRRSSELLTSSYLSKYQEAHFQDGQSSSGNSSKNSSCRSITRCKNQPTKPYLRLPTSILASAAMCSITWSNAELPWPSDTAGSDTSSNQLTIITNT